jgi:hypothetical protein
MITGYEYYYNDVPGKGLCRNNLIYTSLISKDHKTFCQWYYNDTEYHRGQNQVVDPALMEEKWLREVNYITQMRNTFPDLVPNITNIDLERRRLYFEIDGPDFWQLAGPTIQDYDSVLPDWREQMLNIFKAHKALGIYKYSLHPSSYFVVNGKLKSINYFFCYRDQDPNISIRSVLSHISEDRQADLFPKMAAMGINVDAPTSFKDIQMLAFESFKTNFPADFMEEAKSIYE